MAIFATFTEPVMQTSKPSNAGQDNLFGICHALGQDFGFNPLWLRLAFGAVLLANPVAVISAYFALGLIVLVSRFVYPAPRRRVALVEAQAA
jgi:phage shock protein C